MKLAIVVDSSCGLTKDQASARGWYYLPLIINIDGKEYLDGIDITPDTFLKIFKPTSEAKTSFTRPIYTTELLNKLSVENDFVVIYPISKYLSSQYEQIEQLIQTSDYKNVFVVKSTNVAQLIVKDLVEFEAAVLNNELTVQQAIEKIETRKFIHPPILLFPEDIKVLEKGGRLSPSAAKMAKLLRIVPVIALQNGKLEKYDKGHIFNKAVVKYSVGLYQKWIAKEKDVTILFLDVKNQNANELFKKIKEEANYSKDIIHLSIPPVIAIHTGHGAIAIFLAKLEKTLNTYQFDKIS